MDSMLDEFTRQIIEYRHTQLRPNQLHAVAVHLREVVEPQLVERERLLAENADLKRELAALKKKAA